MGTVFTANFFIDAPLSPPGAPGMVIQDGTWDISLVLLNIGGVQVVTQPNPGWGFLVSSSCCFGGVGAWWSAPEYTLPAGLVSLSLSTDINYRYEFADGSVFRGNFSDIAVTRLSPVSVPEPMTHFYGLGGLAVLAIRRKWARRTPM
jgi:hypothetical protein